VPARFTRSSTPIVPRKRGPHQAYWTRARTLVLGMRVIP